jgi:RNA polymerase sigma-70 factor, ECF subfamily
MVVITRSRGQCVGDETEQDLQQLLAATASGDVSAFERVYDTFERPVYSVALRAVGDQQKAEEVVQDTFLKVWRSASAFDPEKGSGAGWIFTIARRAAIDLFRREQRTPIPSEKTEDASVPDGTEEMWAGWQVNLALSMLPEEQRRPVDLSVIAGFTHAEVARELDIPIGTVKTRIYGGLKKLRHSIGDTELGEWSP